MRPFPVTGLSEGKFVLEKKGLFSRINKLNQAKNKEDYRAKKKFNTDILIYFSFVQ